MKTDSKKSYRAYLSKEEIKFLRKPSDKRALSMFIINWLMIAACFVLIAYSNSIFLNILALFVMAGRQLGIGILLHECSHRSFFSKLEWNQFFGHWFGGMPLLVPMDFYRPYHLSHHSKTGTKDDPDVKNIQQYPVTRWSLVRKFIRDFSGLSGVKIIFGVVFYVLPNRSGDAVSMGRQTSKGRGEFDVKLALKNYAQALSFHAAFFSIFWLAGAPSLYVYWWVCLVFVYPFIIRMRQIAEHGAMTKLSSDDVRDTTRTTLARWWERLIFAPNFVNFHCEHHYLPTVPSYRLAEMHDLLKQRGFYDDKKSALVDRGGYLEVGRLAVR